MRDLLAAAQEALPGDKLWDIARAGFILVLGFAAARIAGAAMERWVAKLQTPQQAALTRRATAWGLIVLTMVMTLRELGFDLTALLGAAGVLTVAIGFASQTSASNLISGLFLLSERGFEIGGVIKVGDTVGEVISIDLLSVKLRTFDNLLVRIPNETLIKSTITILSHFPIRRLDLPLGAAYHDDLQKVEATLMAIAGKNPLCLEEPAPLFMVLGFGDNSVTLQFSVWCARLGFLEMRTSLLRDIKATFDAEGLTFPFPQRTLHLQAPKVAPLAAVAAEEKKRDPTPA
jgi:small-conductance mechanosensitive channel